MCVVGGAFLERNGAASDRTRCFYFSLSLTVYYFFQHIACCHNTYRESATLEPHLHLRRVPAVLAPEITRTGSTIHRALRHVKGRVRSAVQTQMVGHVMMIRIISPALVFWIVFGWSSYNHLFLVLTLS